MGRRETPVDPAAGPVQQFAHGLRRLRQDAGGPTYRGMARDVRYSVTSLSQAAAGEQLPSLAVTLAYVEACGGDPEKWERRWQEVAQELAAHKDEDVPSPYQGLARFEPGDQERFFGRAALVEELRKLVLPRRFAAVFGPSGSGKSSLLRAGLIPALRTEAASLAAIRILTPGEHPMRTHEQALRPKDATGDTVLVIDQFEEVFTLCRDTTERAEFLEALLAARQPDSRLRVVIAVRADFYGRCAEHRILADAVRDANLLVGPMSPAELRDAIVKPAQAAGLTVERALTARILSEIADKPGGLPLMSHALLETWRRRKGRMLTEAAYEAIGGIHGAVATTAEQFYTGLPPAQASLARRILLRLVTPGEGDQDTSRPAARAELETDRLHDTTMVLESLTRARLITLDEDTVYLAHEALISAWPRLRAWIDAERDRLRAHRRLTEAARTWHGLGRDPGALYRGTRLATSQELFASSEHHADLTAVERNFLAASVRQHHRSTRLRRAVTATLVVLTLLASAAAVTAYRQSTTAQAERSTAIFNQITAQADRLRGVQSSLAAQLDLTAHRMRSTPELYTRLVTDANSPLSAVLPGPTGNIASMQFSPNGRALVNVDGDGVVARWNLTGSPRPTPVGKPLTGQTEALSSVAFSSDGRMLANADSMGTIQLWNLTDPRRPTRLGKPLTGHSDLLSGMAFSPDGRTLASASHDGTLRLWDLRRPSHPTLIGKPVINQAGMVTALAFSPDGHTLATADIDGTVRLHSLTDPSHPKTLGEVRTGHSDVIYSFAFSPDGHTLATAAGDGAVRLWKLTDPARPEAWGGFLTGHTKLVRSITFSPDGRTLASASHDGTVRLWNTANLASPKILGQPLTDHTNVVSSAVFSPDGRTLATAGDDGRVRLWELPSGVVTGHNLTVVSTAFIPDGRIMASASYDGTVRLWNTGRPTRPEPLGKSLPSHTAVTSVVISPDGHIMATSGYESGHGDTVRLWNIDNPTDPEPLGTPMTGHTGAIESVAFSPDGQVLASASYDGTVRLWNVTDSARPKSLGNPLAVHNEAVYSVTFSPDGHVLATAANDSTVRLWNVTDPARPKSLGNPLAVHNEAVYSVTFSPDGHVLAT
ncbi:WD40 repeat domain-containing protein, partial [Streptomyces sp. NPDC059863]|uniref:nSTAND1 domain-containing NTPase n=1 Tax=unclassified Streptomyces TaxID=2593676 RepID=UPI003665F271